MGIFLLAFWVSAAVLIALIKEQQIIGIIFSSISLIAWVLVFIFFYKGDLFPASYVEINSKRNTINKENISLLIAIATLVIYVFEVFRK